MDLCFSSELPEVVNDPGGPVHLGIHFFRQGDEYFLGKGLFVSCLAQNKIASGFDHRQGLI